MLKREILKKNYLQKEREVQDQTEIGGVKSVIYHSIERLPLTVTWKQFIKKQNINALIVTYLSKVNLVTTITETLSMISENILVHNVLKL